MRSRTDRLIHAVRISTLLGLLAVLIVFPGALRAEGLILEIGGGAGTDEFVTATEFRSVDVETMVVKFVGDNGRRDSVLRTRVKGIIHFPPLDKMSIVSTGDLQLLNETRSKFAAYASRFPKVKPLLDPWIRRLDTEVQMFKDNGLVKVSGKWIPRETYQEQRARSHVPQLQLGGATYSEVKLVGLDQGKAKLMHSGGVFSVAFENLDDATIEKLNATSQGPGIPSTNEREAAESPVADKKQAIIPPHIVEAAQAGAARAAASAAPARSSAPSVNRPAAATMEVVARGVGKTAEDALKAAQQAAVEQAVGQFVDAETLIANKEVITDQVLTASNGFIESYDVIGSQKDGGLVQTRIRAVVRSGKVAERMRAAMETSVTVNSKNLLAEIQTKSKSRADQRAMLQTSLNALPVGIFAVQGASAEMVQGVSLPDGITRLRIPVEISVDQKVYEERVARLMTQLREFAVVKRSTPLRMVRQDPVSEELLAEAKTIQRTTTLLTDRSDALDSKQMFPAPSMFAGTRWFAASYSGRLPEEKRATQKIMEETGYAWEGFHFVDEAGKKAQEDLTAVLVIHGLQNSGVYDCSVFGVPSGMFQGVLENYSGMLKLEVECLDAAGSQVARTFAQVEPGGERTRPAVVKKRSFGSWNGINFDMGDVVFLIGGAASCRTWEWERDGERDPPFEIDTVIIAPGAASRADCNSSWRQTYCAVTTAWRGNVYFDLEESEIGKVASVEFKITTE